MSLKNILLIGMLSVLTGCAGNSSIKRPPETYFSNGKKLYAKGKYEDSINEFKKVKESYSSPILATAAELMIADAQFADKNYIEAAAAYEDFRKLHPNSEKAPYALYKLGMSHLNQVKKIDVDQTPLKNAIGSFELFLKEYPTSELKDTVAMKLEMCRRKQSEYEIYVGRFYFRTGKYASAISRLKDGLEKFPTSPANDEALFYLGQAYIESGDKAKGKEALERLIKDYKNSKYLEDARKLLLNKA